MPLARPRRKSLVGGAQRCVELRPSDGDEGLEIQIREAREGIDGVARSMIATALDEHLDELGRASVGVERRAHAPHQGLIFRTSHGS